LAYIPNNAQTRLKVQSQTAQKKFNRVS